MQYGSPVWFLTIAVTLGLTLGVWLLFRRRSARARQIVIWVISLTNVAQHLLKHVLYPNMRTFAFSLDNTAYNMCATLILLTPLVLFFARKDSPWRDFIAYLGSVAGFVAICVPYWFIGKSIWNWGGFRFYFCHILLFMSSVLPVLWRDHRMSWRHFPKIGGIYFLCLAAILLNDLLFYTVSGVPAAEVLNRLENANPVWMMHPPAGFDGLVRVITALTPGVFLGGGDKLYTPILWYAVPLYLLITVLALCLGSLLDHSRFRDDLRAFRSRIHPQ